jgi:hypothetical protein
MKTSVREHGSCSLSQADTIEEGTRLYRGGKSFPLITNAIFFGEASLRADTTNTAPVTNSDEKDTAPVTNSDEKGRTEPRGAGTSDNCTKGRGWGGGGGGGDATSSTRNLDSDQFIRRYKYRTGNDVL